SGECSKGVVAWEDRAAWQQVGDRSGQAVIGAFAERWLRRLPLPFGRDDERAGYWWELSMRQVEVSRTIVFDAPRRARGFFEALVADNLDLGRPDEVQLTFAERFAPTRKATSQPKWARGAWTSPSSCSTMTPQT